MLEIRTLRKPHVLPLKESVSQPAFLALSIFSGISFFLIAIALLPVFAFIWLVSLLFDRDRLLLHSLSNWCVHKFLVANPLIQCRFEGLSNLRMNQPCVIVANHQSVIDILVLCGLPGNFKWIAKRSIFQIPAIGWIMRMGGDVCLVAKSVSGGRRMFRQGTEWLKRKVSVVIFPEGTRSESGELLTFKDGPFRLATACGVPVVPIAIEGTAAILPKYSKMPHPRGVIRVSVLPAVYPNDYHHNAAALRDAVRADIGRRLKEMRSNGTAALEASSQS
ncbi:MAG: 1-acyl-sn-glycerol-3-phosphate acyltransferase [Candidatus Melainabacteria bacterium]|nr:MAG: 1-acyl-sn-glycerol-3-phosphate acyltransferase [Candidatus Melainabacteria bacterium]